MSKRKADLFSQNSIENGNKKQKHHALNEIPATKKTTLLLDSDSEDSDDSGSGGVALEEEGFKINEEYAKRFEHNEKRKELHRLEEKYKSKSKGRGDDEDEDEEDDDESSTSEEEDDEGFLVTEDLDAEISATLQAIRSKDPRVYDQKTKFFTPIEEAAGEEQSTQEKEKPMYLRDYHRENLLKGYTGAEDLAKDSEPKTYVQEQEELKRSIVQEMKAAAAEDEDVDEEEDDDGGFLIPKSKPAATEPKENGVHPSRAPKVASKVELDVENADKDPELFLSNFMASKAWVAHDDANWQPFESDDDEEDARADKFEEAYNLRFEDPANSNEVLKSYARDIVASRSVRREEPKGRKKQRELERERKEAEKKEREEERARLRKLKIEQMEEKLEKIKKTAGISGKTVKDEDWTKFLNAAWDDDKWEEEMNKRFGEEYYAEQEEAADDSDGGEDDSKSKKTKKPKKPKWDDDIDIKDLVPDFESEEKSLKKPTFTLSDSEDDNDDATTKKASKKQDKQALKAARRLERKQIEDLVDAQLALDTDLALSSTKNAPSSSSGAGFRYRETSPTTFGLTARDILLAPSDAALNQFVGLKKMATFRDEEKKRKDKKRLGKKARLREWRREVFGRGNEDGPGEGVVRRAFGGFFTGPSFAGAGGDEEGDGEEVNIVEGKKKKGKKRSRKGKGKGKEREKEAVEA